MAGPKKDRLYYLFFKDGTDEVPFYVGRSSNPEKRFKQHMDETTISKKTQVIKACKQSGLEIGFKDMGLAYDRAAEEIFYWELRNQGHLLTNDEDSLTSKRNPKNISKKPIEKIPVPLAGLKKAANWVSGPDKAKVLSHGDWTIKKYSWAAGNKVSIKLGTKCVYFLDHTMDWKKTYEFTVLVCDSIINNTKLPTRDGIVYKES